MNCLYLLFIFKIVDHLLKINWNIHIREVKPSFVMEEANIFLILLFVILTLFIVFLLGRTLF